MGNPSRMSSNLCKKNYVQARACQVAAISKVICAYFVHCKYLHYGCGLGSNLPSWSNANLFHFMLYFQYLKAKPCAWIEILKKKVPSWTDLLFPNTKFDPSNGQIGLANTFIITQFEIVSCSNCQWRLSNSINKSSCLFHLDLSLYEFLVRNNYFLMNKWFNCLQSLNIFLLSPNVFLLSPRTKNISLQPKILLLLFYYYFILSWPLNYVSIWYNSTLMY